MKVIEWNKTYFNGEEEHRTYYLKDKTDSELVDALRELWEREVNDPDYDIEEHLEETFFEETSATVEEYGWYIHMWIEEVKEEL